MTETGANKRIAKNTVFLYIRMLFAVIINLFASRLLLQKLGVEQYGVYNLVGGIVALMLFVNTAMQGATTRFITYSLGKNNDKNIKETVNASIHIHFYVMILFLLVAETIGLWFVYNKLNIPETAINSVQYVYQFSILTASLGILQVPFSALVISYERMDVFAFIEVLNVLAKCSIIFLLPFFSNRLGAYAFLIFLVAFMVFLCYIFYCKKRISGYSLSLYTDKDVAKPIFKFALWNMFGNGTHAISQQGNNILINRFFGVAFNAASGVASQASSILTMFVSNIQSAFTPQVIKEYSIGNIERMQELICKQFELMVFLAGLVFTPLYINIEFLMTLWLKDVPSYAVDFCKVLLLCNIVQIYTNIVSVAIQATGRNKLFSFIVGSINLLSIFLVAIVLYLGAGAVSPYYVSLFILIVKFLVELILIHKYEHRLEMKQLIQRSCLPIIILLVSFVITYKLIFGVAPVLKLISSAIINGVIILILVLLLYPTYRILLLNYIKHCSKYE